MVYENYNENSSLFPNQAVQGRANSLYLKEDVPVLPRRYHEKLRDGDEHSNLKRLYPEDKYPEFWERRKAEREAAAEKPRRGANEAVLIQISNA